MIDNNIVIPCVLYNCNKRRLGCYPCSWIREEIKIIFEGN